MVERKWCAGCGRNRRMADFSRDVDAASGRRSRCKFCCSKRDRSRYHADEAYRAACIARATAGRLGRAVQSRAAILGRIEDMGLRQGADVA